jgi:PAT family beta-lactamase induction signal transducer AmpG
LLSEIRPQAATQAGITLIAIVHAYENIAAGLGSAALMVYLMRLCDVAHKATHFAIGSAIMSIGATFLGGFGGFVVEWIGYTGLFLCGFAAAVPSMLMLFWVPMYENQS